MTDRSFTDIQIRTAFEARTTGTSSPELAERIASATRATRQQPRLQLIPGGLGRNSQRLLWAAAISATSLALVGGLLFAGRQPDEQTSVIPSGSPTATPSEPVASPSIPAEPTSSPAPSIEPDPSPTLVPAVGVPAIELDTIAVSRVDSLRVRSAPGVGSTSQRLEPLLPLNARMLVIDGPVPADGYGWYHVVPVEAGYPAGWVAAADRTGGAWIEQEHTACPPAPLDAADLASLGVYGGLACYGNQEIEVTGLVTCDVADVDNTISGPTWISRDSTCSFVLDDSQMYFNPDGIALDLPMTDVPSVVTGHFADPQSASCVWAVDPPAPDPAEVTAACRAMFVATRMESPS